MDLQFRRPIATIPTRLTRNYGTSVSCRRQEPHVIVAALAGLNKTAATKHDDDQQQPTGRRGESPGRQRAHCVADANVQGVYDT